MSLRDIRNTLGVVIIAFMSYVFFMALGESYPNMGFYSKVIITLPFTLTVAGVVYCVNNLIGYGKKENED